MEPVNKNREPPPKIPLEKAKIEALVRAWIEDEEIKLRLIGRQPTLEEKNDPRCCLYHRSVSHPASDCYPIRSMYRSEVQRGEIVQEAKNNPLPNHRQINTCIAVELDPEPIVVEESGYYSESLTQEDELVDSLMKTTMFKNLFKALEFNEHTQKEATTAIVEISTKLGEQCCVIRKAIGNVAR